MPDNQYLELAGAFPVRLQDLPVQDYDDFCGCMISLLESVQVHCVLYIAFPYRRGLKFISILADDANGKFYLLSHETGQPGGILESLTPKIPALHLFEREIHETYGTVFQEHPRLNPVRFGADRFDRTKGMNDYPFYRIDSEELHEVGVGPIHAGVIEPGHFRFICNGERILHLEIQLGYQHRGIESLIARAGSTLRRAVLAESIAGDTTIGHGLAFAQLVESLSGIRISETLEAERAIALELERIAVHIGDTAALCTDVAYQFGQVVNEALRTTIINTTQLWCGNRFGKGLIHPGGTHYPLTPSTIDAMIRTLEDSGRRYRDIAANITSSPSILARFDGIGTVTREQALSIGTVGMAARMAGLPRDIRTTHPSGYYTRSKYEPVIQETGDVLARLMVRILEVEKSIEMVSACAKILTSWHPTPETRYPPPATRHLKPDTLNLIPNTLNPPPDTLAFSVIEGWRGEIAHALVTGPSGEWIHYKVKDPSLHNWMALALAVRNQEISDFPVCNKSFNLSYCGHDL